MQIFHDLILQGLQDSENTYIMLNYFFTTFYMKNCPEQYIQLLLTELEKREDLKFPDNILIRHILIMYMHHRVSNTIQFNLKDLDNSLHLVLLNYLNVVAACRKISS